MEKPVLITRISVNSGATKKDLEMKEKKINKTWNYINKVQSDRMESYRAVNHWKNIEYMEFAEWYCFGVAVDKLLE